MKLTLLDLTQNILSSLNSDEVNSISDSTESMQVAQVIKTVYFNILSRAGLTVADGLFELYASGDINKPALMTKPSNVNKIEWIKYNIEEDLTLDPVLEPNFGYITILPLQQFTDMVNNFGSQEDNVEALNLNNSVFYYKNDRAPLFCTVLDNYYVIFDSYNATVENTLQSAKTFCYGQLSPAFTMSDSFVPDLDDQQFPLLLNEAKSLAFMELKQVQHPKAEQESKRQWSTLQKNKNVTGRPSSFDQLPNYGRNK